MTDDAAAAQTGLDTTVSHSARIWNYWLGGKDNFAVDREAGDRVAAMLPIIVTQARADRAFLGRAVRYLADQAGIRQFLDIGTGLPTADNTHQVAQRVAPEARIVYVDNDPLVLSHARALLTSSPEGACDYIDADLREPGKVLSEAARTLDFTQPVALLLLGVLHHISGTEQAQEIVRRLVAALVPGSFLAVNHSTSAVSGAAMEEAVAHWNQGRHTADDAAQPGADRPVLRRAEPAGAWRGVMFPVAPGHQPAGRPATSGRRILRRRQQVVTGRIPGPVPPALLRHHVPTSLPMAGYPGFTCRQFRQEHGALAIYGHLSDPG